MIGCELEHTALLTELMFSYDLFLIPVPFRICSIRFSKCMGTEFDSSLRTFLFSLIPRNKDFAVAELGL